MQHSELKKYMMSFPIERLKEFLGYDLVESLLEWNIENDAFLTKSRLTDMILSIYGVNILKQSSFRNQLVRCLPKQEILDFRVVLPKKYNKCEDLVTLVEVVSKVSWRENEINKRLLTLLSYSTNDIFLREDNTEVSKEKVYSYDKFYELLDYQYIIRQRALNILCSPYEQRRFLIHMPTGTGKTKTATHIICHHFNYNLQKKGLVIWIAHTTELLHQACETFSSVWKNIGCGDIVIHKLWGKHSIEIDGTELSGFMVCGIQKLQVMMKDNPETFKQLVNQTRLVIYDEAHKAAANETRSVLEQFMRRTSGMKDCSLMGLSATPGRSTGVSFDNDLLVSLFGNKIISIDTKLMNAVNMSAQEAANASVETDIIKYFQKRGVLSNIRKEELTYSDRISQEEINAIKVVATENGYDDFSKSALEIIGRNKNRNLRIMQKLRALNVDKKPTIVFACSVKHGQLLSSMLSLEDIPNGIVIGNMSSAERTDTIRRFKDKGDDLNILINYEVLTTGFDSTNIECVFIARPTQSVVLYSQMLGRGLRGPQMGGNEECLLIDVKDNLCQFNENLAFRHFDNYWNA